MKLDEAITHAEEMADRCSVTDGDLKCEMEHRQLAEWLKDYKRLLEEPEIIRCKDCVHWVNNKSNYNYCEWWDEAHAEEDDFCSWAERKDNDESRSD